MTYSQIKYKQNLQIHELSLSTEIYIFDKIFGIDKEAGEILEDMHDKVYKKKRSAITTTPQIDK